MLRSKKPRSAPAKPVLLLINADTSKQPTPPADRSKERLADYTALREALPGEILDWQAIAACWWASLLARVAGKGVALAALAFSRHRRYRLFYCDSENNGLVLALLFKLARVRRPLLTIGHWITPPKKSFLFKRLKVHSHITTLFLHSSVQCEKAVEELGIPAEKIQLLPYQVDTEFWKLENAAVKATYPQNAPYICTAGLEFRDYPTLIKAIHELEVDLHIGAASHWSKRRNTALTMNLPSNVTVRSYNYTELRDLYAGSRFVVVPLYEVDFQAGITVILEAMAMGKPVVVSHSTGQTDMVKDRRKVTRGLNRPAAGRFVELFGGDSLNAPTGFYVPAGNAEELRKAIRYLLENPERAREMGANSRRVAENLISVEQFATRVRRTVLENLGQPVSIESKIENRRSKIQVGGLRSSDLRPLTLNLRSLIL